MLSLMRVVWLFGLVTVFCAVACGGDDERPGISIEFVPGQSPAAATATRVAGVSTPSPAPVGATALMDVEVHVGPRDDSFVIGVLPSGTTLPAFGKDGAVSQGASADHWLALPGIGWVRRGVSLVGLSGPLSQDPFVLSASALGLPLSPSHPAGYRTGTAKFDRVIELMETGNVTGLRQLIRGVTFPCAVTPSPGIGVEPVCPPGVLGGTGVEGIAMGMCEGYFVPRAEAFGPGSDHFPYRLFAITSNDLDYLIFTSGSAELTVGLRPDGQIQYVRVNGCSSFTSGVKSYVVPPLKPPQLR
jgi:hypothetical protein